MHFGGSRPIYSRLRVRFHGATNPNIVRVRSLTAVSEGAHERRTGTTRASRDTVPVIPALAGILNEYRRSMGNPEVGVIFHSGSRLPINVNNLARRVIRPALEAVICRGTGGTRSGGG